MTLEELYQVADNEDITVMPADCRICGSMSIKAESGNCYIGIDKSIESYEEKKVRLAHEIGHCVTDSFYNRYTLLNNISKQEYCADKWAISQMIPLEELTSAFRCDYVEPWEIADYFGVTLEYASKALKFYGLT